MDHLSHYQHYLLTESVILTSDDVSYILSKCTKSRVGLELWLIIGDKKDVTTDFNTLGLSDKSDELFFLADVKTQKLIADGDDPFGKNKQAMKIGRIARAILSKNNITVSDKDIEEFVNEYKAQYDIKKNSENAVDVIKIVEGEDIRFWYNAENYDDSSRGSTILGQSCMRYRGCQEFLDIYVNNPGQCRLLIYLTADNKLKGRALIWKLHYPNKHYFLDRIYTIHSSDKYVMTQWLVDNLPGEESVIFYEAEPKHTRVSSRSHGSIDVILSNGGSFDYYPYMDTLQHYTPDESKLSADEGELKLISTEGQYEQSGVYCEYEGDTFPEDDTVYSDYHGLSMRSDNANYSEYHSDYLWHEYSVYSERDEDYYHRDEANFSEHLNDYILSNSAAQVYLDTDGDKSDYYDKDTESELFGVDEFSGNYYLKEFLTLNNDTYILTKCVINVYKSTDDKPKMLLDPVISELDAKLFKVKVSTSSKIFMDVRSYYAFKLRNHGIIDNWIDLVKNTKASKKLKNRKLQELTEQHELLMLNHDYEYDYYTIKVGGPEAVLSKWKNLVNEFAKTISRKDLNKAVKEELSHRTLLLGNYYFLTKSEYDESNERNKKPLKDLVSMMFKCLPNYLSAFKQRGFLHSYTSGSLGDRSVFMSIIKTPLIEATHRNPEDISEDDSRIFNTFRAVYNELLKPVYDKSGDDLAKILQHLVHTKRIKI